MQLPDLIPVQQTFPKRPDADFVSIIPASLASFRSQIQEGNRIAIGVGSRGITGYREQILTVIKTLRSWRAEPFLFPAMGSHGGGTDVGQRGVG